MADGKDEGHLIGELLAAPIRAIQEAQIAAEREFVQFFIDYGLETVKRREGRTTTTALRVRNIDFEMRRAISDPSDPGTVIERTAKVSAPLLSMINLPSVAIEEATIDLSLDIVAESEETRTPARAKAAMAPAAASALPAVSRPKVQLRANIGNSSLSRSLQMKGRLNVSLKLVGSRDQEMLGRLTNLVTESLSAKIDERG